MSSRCSGLFPLAFGLLFATTSVIVVVAAHRAGISYLYYNWSTMEKKIRGVKPELESFYLKQRNSITFECLDGTIIHRMFQGESIVNDNYCDCPDATDERTYSFWLLCTLVLLLSIYYFASVSYIVKSGYLCLFKRFLLLC